MAAILKITDGADEVSLIGGLSGFGLVDWTPAIPGLKGGGTYRSSSMSDGRALVSAKFDNVVDTFRMLVYGGASNKVIESTQDLRRLLQKAREYWTTPWQDEPVWIEARGPTETNIRYTIIHNWSTPQDDNPFAQPFFGCPPVMDNFTLTVEHGPWLGALPGVGECMALSSSRLHGIALGCDDPTIEASDETAANMDAERTQEWDISRAPGIYTELRKVRGVCSVDIAGTYMRAGIQSSLSSLYEQESTGWTIGLSFPLLNIPPGATICSAVIRLAHIRGDGELDLKIWVQSTTGPAIIYAASCADFDGRPRIWPPIDWFDVPNPVMGTYVYTPDLSSIVQQVIDTPTWTTNDAMAFQIGSEYPPLDIFFRGGRTDLWGFSSWREFASWAHATFDEPRLTVEYTSGPVLHGQTDPTCAFQNYVADKHTMARLTHIFHYDASGPAWSGNLVNATLPYDLLPAVPAVGDIVYFGISTAATHPGPFCSLVVDLTEVQDGSAGMVWEYDNGGWLSLPDFTDHTNADGEGTGEPFDTLGVRSVHWEQPSDWQVGTINGVEAWWVRCRVTVGPSATSPEQSNRIPYTIGWPYVEIAEDEVGGDLPAYTRWIFRPVSTSAADDLPNDGAYRIIAGIRSYDRGPNFSAYINLSDEQNPDGISMGWPAGSPVVADPTAPTGNSWQQSLGVRTDFPIGWVIIANEILPEYYGRYRVFLRGEQTNASVDHLKFSLNLSSQHMAVQVLFTTPLADFGPTDQITLCDLGIVDLPPSTSLPRDYKHDDLRISINITSDAAVEYILYDLIFIPADEYLFDVSQTDQSSNSLSPNSQYYFDIDGITNPKNRKQGNLKILDDNSVIVSMPVIGQQAAFIQSNSKQRLWVVSTDLYESAKEETICQPYAVQRVHAFKQQRYLGMRGER